MEQSDGQETDMWSRVFGALFILVWAVALADNPDTARAAGPAAAASQSAVPRPTTVASLGDAGVSPAISHDHAAGTATAPVAVPSAPNTSTSADPVPSLGGDAVISKPPISASGSEWTLSPEARSWLIRATMLLPFLSRVVIVVLYWRSVMRVMPEAARDIESHNAATLAIAGFSLTMFSALAVVEKAAAVNLQLAMYFSGMSFVAYFAAFAVQGHKFRYVTDLIGDAAFDSGSLGLMGALSFLAYGVIDGRTKWAMMAIAGAVWFIQHCVRVAGMLRYHRYKARRLAMESKHAFVGEGI